VKNKEGYFKCSIIVLHRIQLHCIVYLHALEEPHLPRVLKGLCLGWRRAHDISRVSERHEKTENDHIIANMTE